jgi:hypothetical protein
MTPRQAGVEPPLGTLTRGWDHGACVRRGREQGRAEGRWTVVADTLRRVLTRGERPRWRAARGCVGPLRRVVVSAASAAMVLCGIKGFREGGPGPAQA